MKYLKAALFAFNLLIWLAGGTVMVCGAWLLMEPSKGHLLNLFTADAAPHETVYFLAYCLLGLGLTVLTVGFFGCRAALRESRCVLAIYMSMLIPLILAEFATATVLGVMTYRWHSGLENRLAERLSSHYGHDATSDVAFSHSFDYAQYKFNCCGIHSDVDYNGTAWWRDSQISGTRRQVPLTCCVLKDTEAKNTGSPMSVISRVFYKNNEKPWLYPQPKDETACQSQDAAAYKSFRHSEGCLAKIRSYLQYDTLVLMGFGLVVALGQALGIITSACLCQSIGDAHNG